MINQSVHYPSCFKGLVIGFCDFLKKQKKPAKNAQGWNATSTTQPAIHPAASRPPHVAPGHRSVQDSRHQCVKLPDVVHEGLKPSNFLTGKFQLSQPNQASQPAHRDQRTHPFYKRVFFVIKRAQPRGLKMRLCGFNGCQEAGRSA